MLSRRRLGACAICAAIGLAGFKAEAQTQGAQSGGITRTVLSKTEFPDTKYATILVSVEIAAGATVARHTHPGVESAFVLEGEGELFVKGQPDKKLKTAESFQIPPEVPHGVRNVEKPLRLAITYVVEKDKPLVSPAPE
jgi:quercetin dioxygenase-like cupin family protein